MMRKILTAGSGAAQVRMSLRPPHPSRYIATLCRQYPSLMLGGWRKPTTIPVVTSKLGTKVYVSSSAAGPGSVTRRGQSQAGPPRHEVDSSNTQAISYGPFIDRFPPKVQPYLFLTRIDKPIGTWLLYWPCAWSIGMASYHAQILASSTASMLALFGTGAIIMRSAGCTINDMWDVKFDRQVERTKIRPLASGAISYRQALGFLAVQLSAGLVVLTQLNLYSIALGACSLSVVIIYPLMKRVTYWPQSVLGLAFNWGALLGWSAMLGSSDWSVTLPLYTAGVSWTLLYDTIYAHQDKKDDVHAGVKSTALLFGNKSRVALSGFGAATIVLLCLAGYNNDQGPLYFFGVAGGGGCHLAWQLLKVDFNDVKSCWRMFKANAWFGVIVFAAIVADDLYRRCSGDKGDN